jgi:hypothetical protein
MDCESNSVTFESHPGHVNSARASEACHVDVKNLQQGKPTIQPHEATACCT